MSQHQGLHLGQRMGQVQILAPQLQQSLAFLQAPTLELRALVAQELEQNPTLEEVSEAEIEAEKEREEGDDSSVSQLDPTEPPEDVAFDPAKEKEDNEPVDDFQAEFEKLTKLDDEWRDFFAQTRVPNRASQEDEEKRQFMMDSIVQQTSLQEMLIEQLRTSDVPEDRMSIAEMIIGNIDDHGFLQATVDELSFSTNIPGDHIGETLKVIQAFHPPGIGARTLKECLLLQLERANRQESLEYRIVRDRFEALAKRKFPDIARFLGVSVEEIQTAAGRIALLESRPGRAFLPDDVQFIVPEVFVVRGDDGYVVTTGQDYIPRLRISNHYKDLMGNPNTSEEDKEYIRDKVRGGKLIIKSIYQRQETLLKIAKEIVSRQEAFLEHGVTQLKPMTMQDISEVVGVHETTVSRAVSGKYLQCPRGIFEMKFFFTSGVKTASGNALSNTSVKEMIAEIVRNEPSNAPYSDEKLLILLKEKDIQVARRTIAKYRSELKIRPSNQRRVY
ncbi:MAG: RNA polymerase sigma-54 factor [Candidatus Binatia bacterium]|jgi:RNA polymerase sigma-54 factor